ncbi:MAG: glycosyltransferase [bacterium]|nr:glycosyltransferase [bacterium]
MNGKTATIKSRARFDLNYMSADKAGDREGLYYAFMLILGIAILGLLLLVKSETTTRFIADPLLIGYSIFVTSFQLSRLVSAMFYKKSYESVIATAQQSSPGQLNPSPSLLNYSTGPIPRNSIEAKRFEPYLSFVIPCKNEEGAIENTITQCFVADYPKNKIEVIVINDGSTDNTGKILVNLKKKFPKLIVVDWKQNKGKRHGMAEGFQRARGEIVIQLDSDSHIMPETVRDFIEPFKNKDIGAVCAHADPENAKENWVTKMQAAYYFMSFRILKAAESSYLTVFCCSGCSSAYRKNIVMPIMNTWLNEKFLGLPVTWGDDRALTNWVLKLGHKTIYTDRGRAVTIVPNNLKQFLKQQVRWKKGWFVNSLFASKFIIKRDPFVAFTYFLPLIAVTIITPFMAVRSLLLIPVINNNFAFVFYFSGVLLMAGLITVYYRMISRQNQYWPYLLVWASINTVLLSFLLFYALATINNRKWGTR